MSSKPESSFIRGVNAHLPNVYFEKMNNPWRSGTADVWYSGKLGDLWIEYKYVPKVPKRTTILPDLSPRQLKWLNDRDAEGRRVAVVVGHPAGGVVFGPGEYDRPMPPEEFLKQTLTRSQLAAWIFDHTGESPCRLRSTCSSPSGS